MKIVILANSLYVGGPEIWALTIGEGLARSGHRVEILNIGGSHPEILSWANRVGHTVTVDPKVYKNQMSVMQQDCRTELVNMMPADVILTWGPPILRNLCQGLDIPVVLCSHTSPAWTAQRQQLEQAASGATHFVAVSECSRGTLPETVRGISTVIENGVSLDRVAPAIGRQKQRERWGYGPQDVVCLYIGRIAPIKRPDRFVFALRSLPDQYKGVMVGNSADGAAEVGVQRLAMKYAPDRIRFLPATTYLGDYLAAADCLVMTSDTEAAPLVFYEAMAAGLPISTTRHEFAIEFLKKHPECAIDPSDSSSPLHIGESIQRACRIDASYRSASRQLIWEKHSAPHFVRRWESYLHSAAVHWRNERIESSREMEIAGIDTKNRLHVIWDQMGWAYWHRAEALAKNAPDNWKVTHSNAIPPDMGEVDAVLALPYGEIEKWYAGIASTNNACVLVAGINVGPERRAPEVDRVYRCAKFVLHNNHLSYEARKKLGPSGVTHLCIPNGVDTKFFKPAKTIDERIPTVLWCGSHYHKKLKGWDLLQLVQKINSGHSPPFIINERLVDSSKPPYTHSQMRQWYRSGDIFLVLSESEGTPNPALEAAACGLVVVATPVGNMPELIRHHQNGFLFDTNKPTPEQVVDAIRTAIKNREKWRNQMLEDIKEWDWSIRAAQYFQTLESLLALNAGPAQITQSV